MSNLKTTLAVIAMLAGFATMVLAVNGTFARTTALERVENKVDTHALEQELKYLDERMWETRLRWSDRFEFEKGHWPDTLEELLAFMTKEAREDYRDLEARAEEIEKKLAKLRSK